MRRRAGIGLGLVLAAASLGANAAPALANTVYVPRFDNGEVLRIDTATNTMVGTPIPTGGGNASAIAILPDGKRVLVPIEDLDRVAVIDTGTNTVVGDPIAVGSNPNGIAISPDGSRAYVAEYGGNSLAVIDLVTNSVTTRVPVGSSPLNVAVTPDGARAYVANSGAVPTVSVIDLATNSAGTPIPVGAQVRGLAVTPDGSRVYVASEGTNSVSVIDTATNTAGLPIPVENDPSGVAISPDGAEVYVTNQSSASVSVISTATNTTLPPITVGTGPRAIAFTPDGRHAYVTNNSADSISVIDASTRVVVATVPLPLNADPQGIAAIPDQSPVAAFTASPNPAQPGQSVSFDGAGSTDPDGVIARRDWDFGDGSGVADGQATVSHSYPEGTYQARLTLTDNEGCSFQFVFTGQTAFCNGPAASVAQTVTVDGTAPGFALSGKRKQPLHASVDVAVKRASEDQTLLATGRLNVGASRDGKRALKAFKLKRVSKTLAAGGGAKLKLKLPRKAKTAATRALRAGGTVRAKVRVTATDAAQNNSSKSRSIQLTAGR